MTRNIDCRATLQLSGSTVASRLRDALRGWEKHRWDSSIGSETLTMLSRELVVSERGDDCIMVGPRDKVSAPVTTSDQTFETESSDAFTAICTLHEHGLFKGVTYVKTKLAIQQAECEAAHGGLIAVSQTGDGYIVT